MKIILNKNCGYRWFSNSTVRVKGYLYDESVKLFKDQTLLNYFKGIVDEDSFTKKIKNANGSFSVIIQNGKKLFAAVDRLGSMPFFYSENAEVISDLASEIKNELQKVTTNKRSAEEFLNAGFVLGSDTLYKEIKRIQAGQYLVYDEEKKSVGIHYYYRHLHSGFVNKTEKEYFQDLNKISLNIFERVGEYANGKQLVVPLSGGYDSRYIASGIKNLNYNNVVCYTYGRKESYEVETSKKVAETLGFKWFFIEYNAETWKEYLSASQELEQISFNFSALPHIQDFMAVKKLLEEGNIQKDSIVVPGYCGDLLGGSYIPKEIIKNEAFNFSLDKLPDYIYNNHMYLKRKEFRKNEQIVSHIKEEVSILNNGELPRENTDPNGFISLNEAFFTNNKVSKFVLNALENFNVLDLKWLMPLWDNELVEYWYKISYEKRISGELYNRYLLQNVFKKSNVDYRKKRINDKKKNFVRKLTGKNLYNILKKLKNIFSNRKKFIDFNAFSFLHLELSKKIGKRCRDLFNKRNSHINYYYAVYMLDKMSDDVISEIFNMEDH